jgi:hypothetical protein
MPIFNVGFVVVEYVFIIRYREEKKIERTELRVPVLAQGSAEADSKVIQWSLPRFLGKILLIRFH